MSSSTQKIFKKAAELASNSKERNKKFDLACIALRKDGVLVKATNITVIQNRSPSSHAEARVLRKSGTGAIIWIVRVLKDKKTWAMAKPCKNCQSLIKNYNVKKVYYSTGPGNYEIWTPDKEIND